MQDFIRARSDEQKEQRMQEIKDTTDALFAEQPYHAITLTTIADRMQCSRAHLYKYATTKEEIFLELSADKRALYFHALKTAFPKGCSYSWEVLAQVWGEILYNHKSYLQYCDILMSITETNVTVERLAAFKKKYYEDVGEMITLFSHNLDIPVEKAEALFYAVYYHAVGLGSGCMQNPLVKEALALLDIKVTPIDFRVCMADFILMCLRHYCEK